MSRTSAAPSPRVLKHENEPAWGLGLVIRDRPKHWDLFFEHAGPKKFVKELATCLIPVTLDPTELSALEVKAHGRLAKLEAGAKRTKPRAPAGTKARFTTFDEQLDVFTKLFPGGFADEAFVKEERGLAGVPGKAGIKEAASALARRELSVENFSSSSSDDLFLSIRKVLQATTMVFPMEGAIPFSTLDDENRAIALAAVKELLHGEGEYGQRLEQFATTVNLKDKKGEPKAVSWPFATIFAAYFNPQEFVCVKPTAFAQQAAIFGLNVAKTQPVSASGYEVFAGVAAKTQELLVAAGHEPRDLLDVYTFIWRTHREKPAA